MMWSCGEDAALRSISKDNGPAESSLTLLVLSLPRLETERHGKQIGEWQLPSGLLSAISLQRHWKTRRAPPRIQELQSCAGCFCQSLPLNRILCVITLAPAKPGECSHQEHLWKRENYQCWQQQAPAQKVLVLADSPYLPLSATLPLIRCDRQWHWSSFWVTSG